MAIKKFKPTSPGRRQMTSSTFEEITTSTPEKSLLAPARKTGGRNNAGRITQRHAGGGHKQRYRLIDFKRDKKEIPARSRPSSMTRTVPRASPCSTMPMVRSVISSRRSASTSATWWWPVNRPTSSRATR